MEDILILLDRVRQQYPKLRLGQLLVAAVSETPARGQDLFYMSDDDITVGLEKLLAVDSKEDTHGF